MILSDVAKGWKQSGIDEGLAKGELKGRILSYQEFLSLPISSHSELNAMTVEQLQTMFAELSKQLQSRRNGSAT
jgi:flagellar biosynthesis/type III secretory pathway protein FliH